MRTGAFILAVALGLLAASRPAIAQRPARIPVIGVLMAAAGPRDSVVEAFRQGLREQGYVEGRNIAIEFRGARGRPERLPVLARELVRLNVDIIFTGPESSLRAAKQATSTIPIVMVAHDYDPVASGLIGSLARPGGNITGVSSLQSELIGKRLELLREVLPGISRVGVLWDSFGERQLRELENAARSLGVQLQPVELKAPYDFESAFKTAVRGGARALVVLFSPVFYVQRSRIAALAAKSRLPAIYQDRDFVEAGGLISYGPSYADTFGRAAYFVDRILKGAKPGDLPVEQHRKFPLAVNLKTASALGLTIPQSLLVQADQLVR
jgi:putative ABC transport system substrate-binding protein